MEKHDQGLVYELNIPLRDGAIQRTDDSELWALRLSNAFPFSLNRVRWDLVPNHSVLSATPRSEQEKRDPEAYFRRCSPRIARFLRACFAQEGVSLEKELVWLGDSTSLVLHLTGSTFIIWSAAMLSYPQHSYLVPPDVTWCFNYTFEDEAYFGRRPPSEEL